MGIFSRIKTVICVIALIIVGFINRVIFKDDDLSIPSGDKNE